MISVVMPVYNGEKYLREAIDSILNQTCTDFEFIILNDASTDETEEIILSYDDPRITYARNETNLQIANTLNKGIALAKGKYIARMDADDISLPERFERQIKFMEDNPDIDVCGCSMKTFGMQNVIYRVPKTHDEIMVKLLCGFALAHPTIMGKRSFLNITMLQLTTKLKIMICGPELLKSLNLPIFQTFFYYTEHIKNKQARPLEMCNTCKQCK